MAEYLDLYSPAYEWMLQCIGHSASQEKLSEVLKKYKEFGQVLFFLVEEVWKQLICDRMRSF